MYPIGSTNKKFQVPPLQRMIEAHIVYRTIPDECTEKYSRLFTDTIREFIQHNVHNGLYTITCIQHARCEYIRLSGARCRHALHSQVLYYCCYYYGEAPHSPNGICTIYVDVELHSIQTYFLLFSVWLAFKSKVLIYVWPSGAYDFFSPCVEIVFILLQGIFIPGFWARRIMQYEKKTNVQRILRVRLNISQC